MDYSSAFQNLMDNLVDQMEALPEFIDKNGEFGEKHKVLTCQVKRLLRFINASKEIYSELNLEILAERIVEKAIVVMRAEFGVIIIQDDEDDSFVYSKVKGITNFKGEALLNSTLVEDVFNSGNSFRLVGKSGGGSDNEVPLSVIDSHLLAAPIISQERLLGVLVLGHLPSHAPFTEVDEDLLMVFASQSAVAIEKAIYSAKVSELTLIKERQRLAGALHDTVAQNLFTIGLNVRLCLEGHELDEEIERRLVSIRRLCARSNCELRSAIYALRSPFLGEGDTLIDLLSDQVKEFQGRTGIPCSLILPKDYCALPSEASDVIYRIVCESLNNISKHADAKTAIVVIDCEDDTFSVTVQDDGIGLEEPVPLEYDPKGWHFGVVIMKQMIERLGGKFTITNTDDQGVMVRAQLPLPQGTEL